MQTKTKLLWMLLWLPMLLTAQVNDCGENNVFPCGPLILLQSNMFSYPANATNEDPLSGTGIGNLADEQGEIQGLISGAGTVYPAVSWNDDNTVGIMDFGTETTLEAVYITVASNPFGFLNIYAGNIEAPDFDFNNQVGAYFFNDLDCPRIYYFPIGNVSTRFLTFERVGGLDAITEVSFCGYDSPETFFTISGCAKTPCDEPVPNAIVRLIELQNNMEIAQQVQATNSGGCYAFANLSDESDYRLEIFKTDQLRCGPSGDDRAAIVDHVLGNTLFDTPYELLAADVNNDDVIDFVDFGDLSDLIFGDITSFTEVGGSDWQFVRSDFVFPDPANPFGLTMLDTRDYVGVSTDQLNQDFVAIKTGDVNCTYQDDCVDVQVVEISGCVANDCGEPVPNATVRLVQIENNVEVFEQTLVTSANGCYEFNNLSSGGNYEIEIAKTDQLYCGPSGDDRARIADHIIGNNLIGTPYKLLAADVNNDDVIDFTDFDDLSDLIFGDIFSFTEVGGNDWQFVRSDFVFPDPNNPFGLTDLNTRFYTNITVDQLNQNFVAIKTGDINCTYESDCVDPEVVSISGCAITECGEPVPNAVVSLTERINGQIVAQYEETTNASGCYEFNSLNSGSNFFMEIAKADQVNCGVEDADAEECRRDLLQLDFLDSPYELLAADASNNQAFTTFDLSLIFSVSNGTNPSFAFSGGLDWKFVRSEFVFPDPTNPFNIPLLNTRTFMNITTDQVNQDFVAIKVGDVNCTYSSDCPAERPGGDSGGDGGRRSEIMEDTNNVKGGMNVVAQPNPFTTSTILKLEVEKEGLVQIKVYTILGEVIFAQEQVLSAGIHEVMIDQLPETANGILPYQIEYNGNIISGKLMKTK